MPKQKLISTLFATLLPVAVFALIGLHAHLPLADSPTAGMEPAQCGTNLVSVTAR